MGRRITIISPHSVPDQTWAVPVGFMGAPTVCVEMLEAPEQLVAAVQRNIEAVMAGENNQKQRTDNHSVFSAEIGGSNGLVSLLVAACMDIPVVDADLMGRAFPELQMQTMSIHGLSVLPSTLSDAFGRCVTLSPTKSVGNMTPADNVTWLERILRPVCVEMGCFAGLALAPLSGSELVKVAVLGSLSRARRIGDCILRSPHSGKEAIGHLVQQEQGRLLFTGKVVDVQRETAAGFARGTIILVPEQNYPSNSECTTTVTIDFQNEFLIARRWDTSTREVGGNVSIVLGCVPDIIAILDVDTARPVATEEIRFGFRVAVLLLPVSPVLRSPQGLAIVGPAAFEFDAPFESNLYGSEKEDPVTNSSIADCEAS